MPVGSFHMTGLFLPVCGVNLLCKIDLLFVGETVHSEHDNKPICRLHEIPTSSPSHWTQATGLIYQKTPFGNPA